MTRKTTGRANARGSRRKPKLPPIPLFDWRTFDESMLEGDDRLREEALTYRDRLDELLQHEGKYVLIKGRDVIGVFTEKDDALREAVNRFRDQPVFIKRIAEKEPYSYFNHVAF